METQKKTKTVNLRISTKEHYMLKLAAKKLSQQTKEKENISKTVIAAVRSFNGIAVKYVTPEFDPEKVLKTCSNRNLMNELKKRLFI